MPLLFILLHGKTHTQKLNITLETVQTTQSHQLISLERQNSTLQSLWHPCCNAETELVLITLAQVLLAAEKEQDRNQCGVYFFLGSDQGPTWSEVTLQHWKTKWFTFTFMAERTKAIILFCQCPIVHWSVSTASCILRGWYFPFLSLSLMINVFYCYCQSLLFLVLH